MDEIVYSDAHSELKVFLNQIYEFQKGVRNMVLHTMNVRHQEYATRKLEKQNIPYIVQPVGEQNINVYFGMPQCMKAVEMFVAKPLNQLTPEEDFILGVMLGYDICRQCERYCIKKEDSTPFQN